MVEGIQNLWGNSIEMLFCGSPALVINILVNILTLGQPDLGFNDGFDLAFMFNDSYLYQR